MQRKEDKKLALLTIVVTICYIVWRMFFTIPFQFGLISIVCGIILLLAEVNGLFEQIVHFWMMSVVQSPLLPDIKKEDYKTVDVFIATYNEPVELLYKTINGCVHMDYPDKNKVNIYLCDDGNRPEMKQLAKKFGIHYLTRTDRIGAKAGNLNHALSQSKGELIVTFDADMIPMHDFLMASVPYFSGDEKIGFVQMPQSFYNLDLFQYNLYAEQVIPNEQDYFYHDIEVAKNRTNSVIYGGSNTVLSREALEEVGGFVTSVITEDFATGLLIQSKGYRCYATNEIHASGLAPSDLTNLIKQRRRWARGCIQTGRKLKILFRKNLSLSQKISYMSAISYWYDSLKRLIYIVAPIVAVVFHIEILHATSLELLIFWLPMYALNTYTMRKLSGNRRTTGWTNIYETILFPFLIKGVILELFGIKEKTFSVTDKSQENTDQFSVRIALCHLLLCGFTGLAFLTTIHVIFSTGNTGLLFVTFWLGINFYHLIIAIFFLMGRKTERKHERFQIEEEVIIEGEHKKVTAVTNDLSEGGFSIEYNDPIYFSPLEPLSVKIKNSRYQAQLFAKVVYVKELEEGYMYSFQFEKQEEEAYQNLLQLLHDRVPVMTRIVDTDVGMIDELQNNILSRQKRRKGDQRKLPRVRLNTNIKIDEAVYGTLVDFNYEYMTLNYEGKIKPKLTLKFLGQTFRLNFIRMSKEGALYQIENLEAICYSDAFMQSLMGVRVLKEEEKEEMSLQETFDEMSLL